MKDYNFYYLCAGETYMLTFFETTPEKFKKVLNYFNDRNYKILKIEEI